MDRPINFWTKIGDSRFVIKIPQGQLEISRRPTLRTNKEHVNVFEFTSSNGEMDASLAIYHPLWEMAYDEKDLRIVDFDSYFAYSNLPTKIKREIHTGLCILGSVRSDLESRTLNGSKT